MLMFNVTIYMAEDGGESLEHLWVPYSKVISLLSTLRGQGDRIEVEVAGTRNHGEL